MAREKGMGNLQLEKSGRWTIRVSIAGKHYSRSTRTKDKAKAARMLMKFLAPLGLGVCDLAQSERLVEGYAGFEEKRVDGVCTVDGGESS